MMRRLMTVCATATLSLTGLALAGSAAAEPPPPCSYVLSAPQVVVNDGVDMVTAAVTPGQCGPPAAPYLAVACLQVAGGTAPMQCSQGRGNDPARVFAPYVRGATYEASGRGCPTWIGQDPAPRCQLLGPVTAAL